MEKSKKECLCLREKERVNHDDNMKKHSKLCENISLVWNFNQLPNARKSVKYLTNLINIQSSYYGHKKPLFFYCYLIDENYFFQHLNAALINSPNQIQLHHIKLSTPYQRIKWNKIVFLKSALYIFATSYNFNSL